MKTPTPFFGNRVRSIFIFAAALTSMSVSAFPLPPAGTPLLGDPQFQTCFDEQALINGWTTTEEVTSLSCPDRDIRDLNGLEVFTNLRDLNLSRNRIEFAFPLDQLNQLEVLDLSHNRLQDIFPLNSLFNLRELYLSGNRPIDVNAPGVSLATVNPVIQNNIGLTHLGVGDMPMDYPGQLATFDIGNGLSENLIELDVSNTGIWDLAGIERAPNLRAFYASGNQLQFANLSDNQNKLEVLDLGQNQLIDVYQLRFLQALKQLNLSGNSQLSTNDVQAIVLNNPGLTHVYLAEIQLPDLDWLPMPGLPGQFDLVELDISQSGNFIHLDQLTRYPNLRVLRATGNRLQDLWSFGQLTQLEVLDLSDNNLSSMYTLSFLNGLTQLNLSGNNGLPTNEVISVIQSNPGLTHLGVSGIALGELTWLPVPGPQGEFNLQELEISRIGYLVHVDQVSQYPELRVLKASGNKLQTLWGSASLAQLEVLDVSDNQLSNLFELQYANQLSQLNLSGNTRLPLTEVQSVILNNPGLTHIGIAGMTMSDFSWLPPPGPQGEYNLLELDISNTGDHLDLGLLGQYSNLRVLKAAGNHLGNAFPIGQLTQLEVLDLGNNELWDIFPLMSLNKLRALNLSGNQSSNIHAPGIDLTAINQVLNNNPGITQLGVGGVQIGNLDLLATFGPYGDLSTKLLELDISNTGIEVVDPLTRAPNLRLLKASGNQIEFTYALQSLTQLEVLDLSHNHLLVITPLQSLYSLRQLNLSGNDRLPLAEVQNIVLGNTSLTHLGLANIPMSNITWLPGLSDGAFNLIELDISNTGSFDDLIPLESYPNLRVLKAAHNRVSYTWSAGQLLQLEVLDLSNNKLQDIHALLPLGSLRQIDLSGNPGLLSIDVQNIIQANPGLTHISVAGIAFNGEGWLPAPGPQGEFDLLELNISNTFSSPVLANAFAYPNLRVLKAAGNDVEFVTAIELLTQLEELDLSDNQLPDASQLLALQNLQRLNLSGNSDLQVTQVQAIVQGNPGLTQLGVAGIAMADLNWLPQPGPQGEWNLQDLDVNDTGLFDLGVLNRYPNLRVLRAAGNQLQNIYFGQIMPLEILDLSNNELWDIIALQQDLYNLRELYLSGNQPSDPQVPGVDLATVNQVIENNPGLRRLGLGGVAIGNLSQLAIFDPGDPVGLNLLELDISHSGVSDIFMIASLPELEVLNVSGNQIFDSLPFTALPQLTELDLSNNILEFVLPLGDLVNLNLLDLRGNNNIQCTELDELELRMAPGVLIRPASCIIGMLPSIAILSPTPAANYYTTDLIPFFVGAGDFEDGDLSGQVQWSSDLSGPIGSGQMFDRQLNAGNHTITASVVDSDGNAASHSVLVSVMANTAPTITIDSIEDGAVFQAGEIVLLNGTAMDAEEGDISPAIQWVSSLQGDLGAGASLSIELWIGNHTISASVTDGTGATTVQTIELRINDLPQLNLQTPASGSIYQQGDTVDFVGSAYDPEDGDLSGIIQWSSDIEGPLGSGAQLNLTLAVGTHTITAGITDSDGATVSKTTIVTVNSLPLVKLLSPSSGSLFMLNETVNLNATAGDLEDGNISTAIQWSSSLDGSLGGGGNLSITNLSLGTHNISASVTDSDGGVHSVTTQIVIDQIALDVTVTGTGNRQKATLTWSGSRTNVDIYKNDRLRRTGGASGSTTFKFKNQATFKVCETGTDFCSVEVIVQTN